MSDVLVVVGEGGQAVCAVNSALQSDDTTATVQALLHPTLQLSALIHQQHTAAAAAAAADSFYHQELRCMRDEKQVRLFLSLSLSLLLFVLGLGRTTVHQDLY